MNVLAGNFLTVCLVLQNKHFVEQQLPSGRVPVQHHTQRNLQVEQRALGCRGRQNGRGRCIGMGEGVGLGEGERETESVEASMLNTSEWSN